MEWLNNPWVVGIGGGILSGIFVTLLSRFLLSNRDKREYAQKLSSANKDVIYAVRPSVSEGVIPSPELIFAMIASTARKHSVDAQDLYAPHEIAQELIKEVMDSSFISVQTKQNFCHKLMAFAAPPENYRLPTSKATFAIETTSAIVESYRTRFVSAASLMMGVLATMMTFLLTVRDQFEDRIAKSVSLLSMEALNLVVPMMAVTISAMLVVFGQGILNRTRSERESLSKVSRDEQKATHGADALSSD